MKIREIYKLTETDIDRIIAMAWEDRTPFEAIRFQFKLSEAEVIKLMRQEMTLKNWKKWRARVQGRKAKHVALKSSNVKRFKSAAQRDISKNNISKKRY